MLLSFSGYFRISILHLIYGLRVSTLILAQNKVLSFYNRVCTSNHMVSSEINDKFNK